VTSGKVNICHSFTVFLAEVIAIQLALKEYHRLRKEGLVERPPALVISSDSQAAILALTNTDIRSRTVLECKRLLNLTAGFTPTHLRWVKAHATSHRNNWVDLLAKEGAREARSHGPFPTNTIPMSFLKSTLKSSQWEEWAHQWEVHPTCRQTKMWFPAPNVGHSRKILQLSHKEIGILIRWITGHNFLRRHANIVDPYTYSTAQCRLCGIDPETSSHIIADCMALDYNRLAALKVTHLVQPYTWDLYKVLRFLEPLAEMMEDTEAPAQRLTLKARNGTRTTMLDCIARHRDGQYSQDMDAPRDTRLV